MAMKVDRRRRLMHLYAKVGDRGSTSNDGHGVVEASRNEKVGSDGLEPL